MSEEPFAVSKIPPPPAVERDYDSICAALMQTERGRWFLQEYARRNRSADTQVLLAAIERIEAVVCADRNRQVQGGMRSDLLEMAKAITRTRAEVAEIRADAGHPDAGHPAAAGPDREASPRPRRPHPGDVFAAAERIREVTWAMRGHGFDPSTCDQLEELAASILSASSLRDPTDHRASKLSDVLQYLEHRIDALLESSQDGDQPVSEPDHDAFEAALSEEAEAGNPFASALATAECAADAAKPDASRKTSVSPQDSVQSAPVTAHEDLEESTAALSPPPTRSAAGREEPEGSLARPPDPRDPPCEPPAPASADPKHGDISLQESSQAGAGAEQDAPEPPISARNHDDEAQIAEAAAPPAPDSVDETELVQGAEPAPAFVDQIEAPPAREPAAIADAEPALATARTEGSAASFDGDTAAAVKPQETFKAAFRSTFQDSFLPQVELPQSHRLMRKSSAAQPASTALREVAARTFLPEIDMGSDRPGFNAKNAEPARGVSLTAAMPAAELAATLEPEQPVAGLATDTHPAEPPGSDLPGVPEGVEAAQIALAAPAELIESLAALPPAAAPVQPAAAARPQAPSGDPLAALKAMSEHELLALFG
jgi:hypothetical protein